MQAKLHTVLTDGVMVKDIPVWIERESPAWIVMWTSVVKFNINVDLRSW